CQVVILCGGKGVRLRERTADMPKPLVEVGQDPIVWHVMRIFESQGFSRFILCLGYRGAQIEEYFAQVLSQPEHAHLEVTLVHTGEETQTGGRLRRVAEYIDSDNFMLTYADGLADIDVRALLDFHQQHGKTATVTAVNPRSPFGELILNEDGAVERFAEKPLMKQWINGGYFVFRREFASQVGEDDVLEQQPLEDLARRGELIARRHQGFWKCMDTYKDLVEMNELWAQPEVPWRTW
ncbi:MAG: sugar phosphate nucleotidyltransferase, partial [Oceanococcaceae bacterium]